MSIQSWFKLEWEILDPAESNDGGIAKKTYSVGLSVYGWLRPLTGNEVLSNEKLGFKSTHRFYTDISAIDNTQLIRKVGENKIYEIRNVKNPMEMDHHLEIDCEYNPDLQTITES